MKSTDVELKAEASHTAEAEEVIGEKAKINPYGKFKDAESLRKAYESLESEFTRRSQRLKAIEGELLNRSQVEKTVEKEEGINMLSEKDFIGRYPNSEKYLNEIENELKGGLSTREDAYIKILERKLDEEKNKLAEKRENSYRNGQDFSEIVIKEYLKKVMQAKPKSQIFSGVSLSVPPLKPTTVAEASAMAKNYIKRKGE